MRALLVSITAVALGGAASPGSEPPKLHGQTLNGEAMVLPDAAAGKVTLLVLGASRKGGERTGPWKDHFIADFASKRNAAYYVIALLQNAPAMFRGMIRAGMRNGTPEPERNHVLTSAADEAEWTSYLGLTDYSLPAVLLLDESGHVLWEYIGVFDPTKYQVLKAAAAPYVK